ncbi:hypothetical protein QWY31_13570 [Cytophagales bacterium LB-30]|uniref:Uncharacterized protein n=1 Tax=Shiella aurantiaca TaxID=3058365 RepID=A0ABT8F8B9_9BACT|nr:hypothetical protein [Shiella aurantiaca]MDN4166533.1 hypothetical protein [Shiella aurantiaca]
MKRSILVSVLAVSIFTACKKDDETSKELSKVEAEAAIDEMADQLSGDIVGIMDSEGVKALESVSALYSNSGTFGRSTKQVTPEQVKASMKALVKSFVPKKTVNGRMLATHAFVFEEWVGVYNYNSSIEDFERVGDSDIIELNFPTEGSVNLNATLSISALDLIEYTYTDEWGEYTEVYPTDVQASLEVDNAEQASIDLQIGYNNEYMPVTVSLELFVNPYTFSFNFTNTNSTSASIAGSIKLNSEVITAIDVAVVKAGEDEIKSATGFVQYREMKLQGSITNPDFMSPEPDSMGDFIKLSLFKGSQKVGDIVFEIEEDEFGEYEVPYLLFSDGSKKPLEEVFAPIIEQLEDEMDEIGG